MDIARVKENCFNEGKEKGGNMMKKIDSFNVDHLELQPGIYISRVDTLGSHQLITYDIRMTAPNDEPPIDLDGIHTIEHTGATWLRNHEEFGDEVIYFGPMGCRTGFYLILTDQVSHKDVLQMMKDMFAYISEYEGEIPGATAQDCGNFEGHSQHWAKYYSKEFLERLENIKDTSFEYQAYNE